MPRGSEERRRQTAAIAESGPISKKMSHGQYNDSTKGPVFGDHLPGQVVEVSTGKSLVQIGERTLSCTLRGALKLVETGYTNVVAVGDLPHLKSPSGAASGRGSTCVVRREQCRPERVGCGVRVPGLQIGRPYGPGGRRAEVSLDPARLGSCQNTPLREDAGLRTSCNGRSSLSLLVQRAMSIQCSRSLRSWHVANTRSPSSGIQSLNSPAIFRSRFMALSYVNSTRCNKSEEPSMVTMLL